MTADKKLLYVAFALLCVSIMLSTGLYFLADNAFETYTEKDTTGYSTNVWSEQGMTGFVIDSYKYENLARKSLQEIKTEISSPEEAIQFRDSNFVYMRDKTQYGKEEYISSLQTFYENNWTGDCEDFSIAIAGLLEDDGYRPIMLYLIKTDDKNVGHAIYVYQENGKWGSIGTTIEDDRLPEFDSVQKLVASLGPDYQLARPQYMANLDQIYPKNAWLNGKGNLVS